MYRILFCVFQIFIVSNVYSQEKWNLNDVSYLFSIPNSPSENLNHLLQPTSSGSRGELLSSTIQDKIPTLLNAGKGNLTLLKGAVRLISFRFDPCPTTSPQVCNPELRLVWQPIELDEFENKWLSRDAALHSFYSLNDKDFKNLKQDLLDLKDNNKKQNVSTEFKPLYIHPAIENASTKEEFLKSLNQIILKYCGVKNLYKVTFMSLLVPTRWWRFGSFVVDKDDNWQMERIPRLQTFTTDLFNVGLEPSGSSQGPGEAMDAIINILPEDYPVEDDISTLINFGYRQNNDDDFKIFKENLKAVERFRNPHRTNSANLDCASCHFADAAKFYAGKRFPELNNFKTMFDYENPNPNSFNLKNKTVANEATRILRAFGYFDDEPAISQRTINDSAESANWLNSN
ncbi:MAG: hypothetical protein H6625_13820 [Bdellovibrionaceae bacterium]|nr:hypothetical protein [Pseudobdellovibrionaceae bacterium]